MFIILITNDGGVVETKLKELKNKRKKLALFCRGFLEALSPSNTGEAIHVPNPLH
jgi:hypothetical protein